MMVVIEASVIYPPVVVKVNNITCMALLDTDPAIFYASSAFSMHPQHIWTYSQLRKQWIEAMMWLRSSYWKFLLQVTSKQSHKRKAAITFSSVVWSSFKTILVMIVLYIQLSRINLEETIMVGTKLDWCEKTILLQLKITNWLFWEIKVFAAKLRKKSRTIRELRNSKTFAKIVV